MAKTESAFHLRETQDGDYPYFRRLWNSVVVALLAASFIPLIMIGGGMYYYMISAMEERNLESLRTEISEHREAIDQFLAERTADLSLLSSNLSLEYLTTPGILRQIFASLQRQLPCFADIGIIDDQGRHLAYVGPYDLLGKNYKEAPWFKAVKERRVYVSDVFLGFRNEPHFVIAVKQSTAEGFWIIRATVDTVYFESMVKDVLSRRSGDAFIVNSEGVLQTVPRASRKIIGQSDLKSLKYFEGVKLERRNQEIIAMAWLQRVPWVCVAEFNRNEIYAATRKARNIGLAIFGISALLIGLTVFLTTNYLVKRLETKRKSIRFLDQQLRHSSKMASSMELAGGFVREINETLSNIDLVIDWLGELSHRDLSKEANRQELRDSLSQIQAEVSRTRKATDRFFKATQPSLPMISDVRIHDILNEIIELLDRELHFNRIAIKRQYQEAPPVIRSDPSQLRQVFQNLILNAITAIKKDGEITLQVRAESEGVSVSVSDSGHGIPKDMQEKIFDPLFTTKPDGAGLGLSVSVGILEKLGGKISVRSEPGKGATFAVVLPYRFKPPLP